MLGDTLAAIDAYREAVRLSRQHNLHLMTITAQGELAQQLHYYGRRPETMDICQQIIEQCVDANGDPLPVAGLAYALLGEMEIQSCDFEKAGEHIELGVELCEQYDLLPNTLSALVSAVQLLYTVGKTKEARKVLRYARQLAAQANFISHIALFEAIEADFCLHEGKVKAAARWAEKADFSPADSLSVEREYEYLLYARLLLAKNQSQEAIRVLDNLEQVARTGQRNFILITVLLRQALAYLASGEETQAIDRVDIALELAEAGGYQMPFLESGEALIKLLLKARMRRTDVIAPEFIDQILSNAEQFGIASGVAPAQVLVDPLSERELEILRLIADGLLNKEIAQRLIISQATVKRHVANIYGKLGVHHRTEAVARARELNLL
jgi:LuxR family maltose regulon positive regulatory protein